MRYIKCDKGDYCAPIDGPWGIGILLAPKVMEWHERGHQGHNVNIVEEE